MFFQRFQLHLACSGKTINEMRIKAGGLRQTKKNGVIQKFLRAGAVEMPG